MIEQNRKDPLIFNDKGYIVIKNAKVLVILETLVNFLIRISGLGLLFVLINYVGTTFFQDSFQSQFLYSVAFIPLVQIVKSMPQMLILPFTIKTIIYKDRIETTTGLYNKFKDSIEIKNIENIESYYSFIGRIFNFKTISIRNYGSYIRLWYVKDADRVISIIKKLEKGKNENN